MNDPEFAKIKPYMVLGIEAQNFNPMFAYYLKVYAFQQAQAVKQTFQQKNNQSGLNLITKISDQLYREAEQIKQQNLQLFAQKQQNETEILDFVNQLFQQADEDERSGQATQETSKHFQIVSRYIDILTLFKPLSQELADKKKYAKFKAVEITKKLKAGTQNDPDQIEKDLKSIEEKINSEAVKNPQDQPQPQLRQSVFNQVPKIINRSTIQDQNAVNRILDYAKRSNFQPAVSVQQNQYVQSQNYVPPPPPQPYTQAPQPTNSVNPVYGYTQTPPAPAYQNIPQPGAYQPPVNTVPSSAPYQPPASTLQTGAPYQPPRQIGTMSQVSIKDRIQSLCKQAISELDFDNVAQARQDIEQALDFIKQLQE